MATKIMPISDLRQQTSQVIQGIQEEGDVVYVTVQTEAEANGKTGAAAFINGRFAAHP